MVEKNKSWKDRVANFFIFALIGILVIPYAYSLWDSYTGGALDEVKTCMNWEPLREEDYDNAQGCVFNSCERLETKFNTWVDVCNTLCDDEVRVYRYCQSFDERLEFSPPESFFSEVVQ